MDRLKKRSDFLRVARGHKQVRRALVLQAWQHQVEDYQQLAGEVPRLGFTVTKKKLAKFKIFLEKNVNFYYNLDSEKRNER